jgi:glycosyltransferase involved in cell wall biosynthesis
MLRKKVCLVASVPYAFNMFMSPHISMLAETNDVTLVCSGDGGQLGMLSYPNIKFKSINIPRAISPLRDLYALFLIILFFRSGKFDVVHSITPKSGLLTMVAGAIARVPFRFHTFTGQVWAAKTGFSRYLLKSMDKLTALCATNLLADSRSQKEFLIVEEVTPRSKISVLGHGSVCGVDVTRFSANSEIRSVVRESMKIPDDALVYLFLGRLSKEKGILDLAIAFSSVSRVIENAHLLVVGPDEQGVDGMLEIILRDHRERYHRVGFTTLPERYMACADLICLPSYREGFGSVIIEAASMGIPAVASEIYGVVDSVENGKTGILHKPRDIEEIEAALIRLSIDDELRVRMGGAAKLRAHSFFQVSLLTEAMKNYYRRIILGGREFGL